MGGSQAIHPDDRDAVADQWRQAVTNRKSLLAEFRLWHEPAREYRYVSSRGIPLINSEGEILEWIGTITDISDRHRLEEKLRQSAKLESLGVLAGGIAHDFNNLLVGILGNAGLLESGSDPGQREILDQIVTAAERAAALTRQMLAYSGQGRFIVEPTNLSSETAQILPLVRSSIPKHVELVLNLAEKLPPADVDRSQFQQLVMNLVINGAEAIDDRSGTVTVATYIETLNREDITRQFQGEQIQPGLYVVLEVQDSGHGMDIVTLSRFSTPSSPPNLQDADWDSRRSSA